MWRIIQHTSGRLRCLCQRFYNVTAQKTQWWTFPSHSEPNPHLSSNFSHPLKSWDEINTNIKWQGPGELYQIYERTAYNILPPYWSGSCVLGSIHPFSSYSHLPGENIWGFKYMRAGGSNGNDVPYKLATGRMMSGPQNV